MKPIQLQPRVSEKAYMLSKDKNVYVFEVPDNSSKQEIAAAVKRQFSVNVTGVNVLISKGKQKRMMNRRGKATHGKRKDIKRAHVTVQEGDTIPVFAAIDEANEKERKAKEKS